MPDEAISCGFTEAVRGVLSHHMVIRDGKIANYHPYPPTPWNGSVRDSYGTPGPYEDAVQNTPIFEENPPEQFKGIDIMRAVRSFDPCLPCGVHMYLGNGKSLNQVHSPAVASSRTRPWTPPMSGVIGDADRTALDELRLACDDRVCHRGGARPPPHRSVRRGAGSSRWSSAAPTCCRPLAADQLGTVCMLLHGLHPDDFAGRVHAGGSSSSRR